MSVADVTARIQQIQGQLSLLSPPAATAPQSAAFASALSQATQTQAMGAGAAAPTGAPGAVAGSTASGGAVDGVPFADLFNKAAAKHGVSATLLAAVAKQESGFNPAARSPAGAQGLMQLMPATARGLGVSNPLDPTQAVDGAARLLKSLINEFGRVDLALAAYNAGPGAVKRYDGIPPYRETQRYVPAVLAIQKSLAA